MLERFTSAECSDCWARPQQADAAGGWLFDWITPSAAAADAALSAVALADARERALRSGGSSPTAQQMRVQRRALPPSSGLRLTLQSGLPWNGYYGLQLTVKGRAPAAATAWLALVEMLPAGTDGSAVARELVRSVAGPLPLQALHQGKAVSELRAMRWPDSAKPERLQARAWVESADGRFLAVAAGGCPAWR